MNRNQRRLGRVHQKRFDEFKIQRKSHDPMVLEEVFPPTRTIYAPRLEKFTTNKCCYVAPAKVDFGQITDIPEPIDLVNAQNNHAELRREQYIFDSLKPETINQLNELKKVLCITPHMVENGSQYTDCPHIEDLLNDSQWMNIENAEDIDKFIGHEKEKITSNLHVPDNINISNSPRIKVIAKKFYKFKKNNVELRKLDEKVVCVEYDVYMGNNEQPAEKLRAFFSIKPKSDSEKENTFSRIPSRVKNDYSVVSEDFKKLNEKEIEIIDGKSVENQSYLEDLKRVLRRKQTLYAKRNKSSLDLMSLYEMAKRQTPPLDDDFSNTNFLSNAELQEMKDLIMKKCASSVHGINRRTVKQCDTPDKNLNVISQSIVAELWREGCAVVN